MPKAPHTQETTLQGKYFYLTLKITLFSPLRSITPYPFSSPWMKSVRSKPFD
ncbi:hypothetical protein PORCAN_1799 [Porphyromonas crevioricanis JCM 13913]|nr:hypothetical protein PORCAN_1799 [Porphyromonas crevioricanis JCM 13913]